MIRKNKLLHFIIVLLMLLTVTGCSKDQNEVNYDSETASSIDTAEKSDNNLSNEFSFMNGKVSIPFKLKNLKNITIDEEICYETDDGCLFSQLWYGDNRIGTVMLENCSVDEKHKEDKNVVYLKISPDSMFDDFEFEYMGLTFSSTREDIINTLGESNVENQLTYMIDDKTKISFKLSDNIVYRVTISSYDFEDE